MTDRLYRHPTDRVIAGVAGGLAVWLNIDPSLVRIAWVLLGLFSGGLFVIVYIVMMIVVPMPPPGWVPRPRGWDAPGSGAVPGWQPGPTWGQGASGWGPAVDPSTGWSTQPGGPAPGGATGAPGGWPASPGWTAPRPGNAGLVVGLVLVALGIWFLVDQYVRINWDFMWPVLIMVAGGGLIASALMRGRRD